MTAQGHGRRARLTRLLATAGVLLVAALAAALMWEHYVTAPWTRDGRVRVQVASIAPQVSGQIVEVRVVDNQFVRKGDVLYVIDPYDYHVAITQAMSTVENRAADLQVKRAQAKRREALTTLSTSVEEKQQYAGASQIAEAAYVLAQAQLQQAETNLKRTKVQSPVNGYVTNLLMSVGDYARSGTTYVSVVNSDSYWIDGYFEETKMANIRVGDPVEAQLMGYSRPIRGRVESITRGIATGNAAPSTQGLPNVDPVYTWVRLAQRVPVRVRIEHVPEGIPLVAGMTATVTVTGAAAQGGMLGKPILSRFVEDARAFLGLDRREPGADVTTAVRGAETVSSIPAPEHGPPAPVDSVAPRLPLGVGQTVGVGDVPLGRGVRRAEAER